MNFIASTPLYNDTMTDKLTVLIPTSPIPSHPSTSILDVTIEKTRVFTNDCIIIMADGIHPLLKHREDDYLKYLERVEEKIMSGEYGQCALIQFPEHTHQAMMTKSVLSSIVQTPLIFFVEHDTFIDGDIPFSVITDIVLTSNQINCIRFNIFDAIPLEHKYLMIGDSFITAENIPFVRTIQWSQRPHIAKTNWYTKILAEHFKEGEKTMIEDRMHSVVIEAYKRNGRDIFGLAIYTPEGNQTRSYHSDGRGADEKIIEA